MRLVSVWLLAAAITLGLAGAAFIRLAPLDPAVWHVDPATVMAPDTRNSALVSLSRVFPMTAAELAGRLAAVGLAEPGTRVLAGDAGGLRDAGAAEPGGGVSRSGDDPDAGCGGGCRADHLVAVAVRGV